MSGSTVGHVGSEPHACKPSLADSQYESGGKAVTASSPCAIEALSGLSFVRYTSGSTNACEDLDELEYAECEALFRDTFERNGDVDSEPWLSSGMHTDEEEIMYEDGVQGIIVRGSPPSVELLESKLDSVKALYRAKFGKDVDAESEDEVVDEEIVYEGGVPGVRVRGAAPSVDLLESKLDSVKALYMAKFGKDVDAESDDEVADEEIVYKGGVPGVRVRGAAPSVDLLESKLDSVKALYMAKFGKDVDAESDDEVADEEIVYQGGVPGIMVRGSPPSVDLLESKLDSVKALYMAKFGKDVDAESDDEVADEEIVYEGGVQGIRVRGAAPSLEALETKLGSVKALYRAKFGKDVDEEFDDEAGEEEIMYKDGVKGIIVRGATPSVESLEAKLDDVKALYVEKFGKSINAEWDDEFVDEEHASQQQPARVCSAGIRKSCSIL